MIPKKYWWPLLLNKAVRSRCLAVRGDGNALLVPSKKGWLPHKGIPGDLWVFRCVLAYILICCATGLWCMIGFFFSGLKELPVMAKLFVQSVK